MSIVRVMNTYEALLRDICENPYDDTPRRIMVDLVEEEGLSTYSAFLRISLERATVQFGPLMIDTKHWWSPTRGHTGDYPPLLVPSYCDSVTYHRGFIDEIHLTVEQFKTHAEELFSVHPITKVVLIGSEPGECEYDTMFGWWGSTYLIEEQDTIPMVIWDEIYIPNERKDRYVHINWKWFDTVELANYGLSRACVNFGRKLVGLKPLLHQEAIHECEGL